MMSIIADCAQQTRPSMELVQTLSQCKSLARARLPTSVCPSSSVVRGYHVYQAVWTPVLHAEHPLQHDNSEDQYAVAVINSGQVVGHVPRELSQTFWYFIEREGEISCIITGRRQRSHPTARWHGNTLHLLFQGKEKTCGQT